MKNFFVSEVFVSELVSLNYPYDEQGTFQCELMC